MPTAFEDLPYARFVEPFEGELRIEGEYDCVRIDGREFTHPELRHLRFNESVGTGLNFVGGNLSHSRFSDVWFRQLNMAGTALGDSNWLDAEIIDSAWSGVEIVSGAIRRVTFVGCKLDAVNFRSATLKDVVFRDCMLRDVDFGEARLTSVTFPGSRVQGLLMNKTVLSKVDFRGAAMLTVSGGIESLRGAIVDSGQLMELAPAFAAAAGLRVED
ncbi:pentapeptide repeat-containing protein [Nocardia crassostreae]|uniref:pentapeptide repeat-containing protein n=1 Tax=Nocardia crassostreae TaxID=53428 RepID=UPI0008304C35|nr:pentapeptide repeat-containing protein [Nocardia crassostreae]